MIQGTNAPQDSQPHNFSSNMEPIIHDFPKPPPDILKTLSQHLPYSLPLYRRLGFTSLPGGQTDNSHILSTISADEVQDSSFTVAYLDFSRGPETEMWLYSSLENPNVTTHNSSESEQQILAILRHARAIESQYPSRETPGVLLIGSLHERVLSILQIRILVKEATDPHFKFLFRREDLPVGVPLPDSLQWATIRRTDIPLVLSRTSIPRKERTVVLLPSVAIRHGDTPIAWAFLGPDGSLTSLHCEESHRGKGLAKAVALKLFRETAIESGEDGWSHADVVVHNLQSQGVCKSLKGVATWQIYWAWINISAL